MNIIYIIGGVLFIFLILELYDSLRRKKTEIKPVESKPVEPPMTGKEIYEKFKPSAPPAPPCSSGCGCRSNNDDMTNAVIAFAAMDLLSTSEPDVNNSVDEVVDSTPDVSCDSTPDSSYDTSPEVSSDNDFNNL